MKTIRLNEKRTSVLTDYVEFLHSKNRYRDLAISSDGCIINAITDSLDPLRVITSGATSNLFSPRLLRMCQFEGKNQSGNTLKCIPNQDNNDIY